jgi:hypothetical protein
MKHFKKNSKYRCEMRETKQESAFWRPQSFGSKENKCCRPRQSIKNSKYGNKYTRKTLQGLSTFKDQ